MGGWLSNIGGPIFFSTYSNGFFFFLAGAGPPPSHYVAPPLMTLNSLRLESKPKQTLSTLDAGGSALSSDVAGL